MLQTGAHRARGDEQLGERQGHPQEVPKGQGQQPAGRWMDLLLSIDVNFSCDDAVPYWFPPFLQQSESLERPEHPQGEMLRPHVYQKVEKL